MHLPKRRDQLHASSKRRDQLHASSKRRDQLHASSKRRDQLHASSKRREQLLPPIRKAKKVLGGSRSIKLKQGSILSLVMEEVEDDERDNWEVGVWARVKRERAPPQPPADSVSFALSLLIYSVFPFSPSCPSTPLSRIHQFPAVLPLIHTL
ncbi:hypothetical protein LXL04_023383 [Taraxacum kok-saghyz]